MAVWKKHLLQDIKWKVLFVCEETDDPQVTGTWDGIWEGCYVLALFSFSLKFLYRNSCFKHDWSFGKTCDFGVDLMSSPVILLSVKLFR